MKQNILYVGLDVDDTQYHGSALNKDTPEALDFKCRPTLKGLLNQLHKVFTQAQLKQNHIEAGFEIDQEWLPKKNAAVFIVAIKSADAPKTSSQ